MAGKEHGIVIFAVKLNKTSCARSVHGMCTRYGFSFLVVRIIFITYVPRGLDLHSANTLLFLVHKILSFLNISGTLVLQVMHMAYSETF